MSSRQISNLTFRSALQADRISGDARKVAIAAFNAKKLAEAQARDAARAALTAAKASPLFVSGSFDRAAVMRLAWANARSMQAAGDKRPLRTLVGLASKRSWSDARAQRRSAAH